MTCLGASDSSAGDFHIRIPNPIPKIVRSVERVGRKVGNVVVRVAERVEDDSPDPRRDPNRRPRGEPEEITLVPGEPILGADGRPLPDPPLAASGEIRREPMADPSLIDGRYSHENPKPKVGAANPGPIPSSSGPYAATQRKPVVSVRPAPPTSATDGTKRLDPTTLPDPSVPVTPPTPAPDILFGKRVPGHPGLVYPPGVEEVPTNMLDVQGMAPGTKVRNPVTKSVFRVP